MGHWTKSQEGLSEDPLTNPEEIWYTDGSNFVLDGKRRARCAVVSNFETIEAKSLPPVVKVPGHDSWIHYSQVKPGRGHDCWGGAMIDESGAMTDEGGAMTAGAGPCVMKEGP